MARFEQPGTRETSDWAGTDAEMRRGEDTRTSCAANLEPQITSYQGSRIISLNIESSLTQTYRYCRWYSDGDTHSRCYAGAITSSTSDSHFGCDAIAISTNGGIFPSRTRQESERCPGLVAWRIRAIYGMVLLLAMCHLVQDTTGYRKHIERGAKRKPTRLGRSLVSGRP